MCLLKFQRQSVYLYWQSKIFYLTLNWMFVSDIDECQTGASDCNQNCINTPGSYSCTCFLGYELNGNNTCVGKPHTNYDAVTATHKLWCCYSHTQTMMLLQQLLHKWLTNDWHTRLTYASSRISTKHFFISIDFDECKAGNDGCDETCENTEGSFMCSCNSPHTLNDNGLNCDSIQSFSANVGILVGNSIIVIVGLVMMGFCVYFRKRIGKRGTGQSNHSAVWVGLVS